MRHDRAPLRISRGAAWIDGVMAGGGPPGFAARSRRQPGPDAGPEGAQSGASVRSNRETPMKTMTKLALGAVLLATAFAAYAASGCCPCC